ncbi:unnamed protein product [Rotaria socialis]|uniref:Helix-turn-helix domain-containing protein n=1 Tax=Rotaria socialis TaxID=392032 RepID=A0A818DBD1_9BILA|nr:unnamed protein product [Rotaria socialis]CAF4741720.1 unnamed protein product [Rotaria socialis]
MTEALKVTNSNTNNDWNTDEEFDDIFNIFDDNKDTLEYTDEELNKYFYSGHLSAIVYEEETIDDDSLKDDDDDDDVVVVVETMQQEEEEDDDDDDDNGILSQKFNQLSTNAEDDQISHVTRKRRRSSVASSSPQEVHLKKAKIIIDDDVGDNINDQNSEQNLIPMYLLMTNRRFLHMAQTITKSNSSIHINDIQQLAVLMHRIATVQIDRYMMKVYLHSVQGTLKESNYIPIEIDRRVWPIQVQSLMLTHHKSTASMEIHTKEEDEQMVCEQLLHQHLQDMKEKIQDYEQQLNVKKQTLNDFTSNVEEIIQNYVQIYGIKPLNLKRDLNVALLNYHYDSELLQRQYLHEQPNEYQIQIAKSISDAKRELEKARGELIELKYRVFYDKPLASLDSIQVSIPKVDDNNDQRSMDKYEKIIHRNKLDAMAIKIVGAETKFYQCSKAFDDELSTMWKNHRQLVKNKGMPTRLSDIIDQRLKILSDRWRDISIYRIRSFSRPTYYNDIDPITTNETKPMIERIGFSSSLIIDTSHSFIRKQLKILNRGPTYVPPCQLSISSLNQSIDDIIKKQYASLKHQLNNVFSKYHVNIALSMEIQQKISDQFTNLFSTSVPSNLQQRGLREKHLVQSIRFLLNKQNLILRRTADNKNTFYLGNRKEFEAKANDYLMKSDDYTIFVRNYKSNVSLQEHVELKQMIESMNELLVRLKNHKSITDDLYHRLLIDASKVKLSYLYFLPDVSQDNEISMVPMITSESSATWKIGKYLNDLLRPFVNKILQPTVFRDEPDFIQKLHQYVYTGKRLQSTTLFCTIQILNYYALDLHQEMIDTVGYFLQDNLVSNKLGTLTIQTIKNLLHIYLYYNIFYYKNQIYKIAKGSPTTMALSEILSTIYLFVWESRITKELRSKNELFGRYKDQIFFTWNNSNEKELRRFLQTIQDKYSSVRFQPRIGSTVRFFNVHIDNSKGELSTRIYHQSMTKKYSLPYVVGHSKQAHSDWLRSALIRAVCCCSSVDDFHLELLTLELAYLSNGYSLRFVESHLDNFFDYFHASEMRYLKDQIIYDKFQKNWFDYMLMQYELTDKLQQFNDKGQLIQLQYRYEYGPRSEFNQQFHQLWSQYFHRHPTLSKEKVKVLLTTKHQYSLNSLLTEEKTKLSSSNNSMSTNSHPSDQAKLIENSSTEQENHDCMPQLFIPSSLPSNYSLSQQVTPTNEDLPSLVDFLSCYVRLTQYQVNNDIDVINGKAEDDLQLQLEELKKEEEEEEEHPNTQELKEILSLYDLGSSLDDNHPMNSMIMTVLSQSKSEESDTKE